jgi:hypothetical protein
LVRSHLDIIIISSASRNPFYDKITYGPSNEIPNEKPLDDPWFTHQLLLGYFEERLRPAKFKHNELLNIMRTLIYSSFSEDFQLTLETSLGFLVSSLNNRLIPSFLVMILVASHVDSSYSLYL